MTNMGTPQKYSRIRIRVAALCLFIAQGLIFASWASRLPNIKADFNVSGWLQFGILLFLIPIGKFFAIPAVGYLIPKIGSKKTVLTSILGFVFSLFVIGFIFNNIYILGTVMFLFGVFWNMTDISLNAQAIEVEKIYGKPIIATFHASWSFAACLGALLGYAMINLEISTKLHFVVATLIAVLLIGMNYKCLPSVVNIQPNSGDEKKNLWGAIKNFRVTETLLLQLGLIWLLALIVENTMFEWSDLYFQSVINAPESMQIGFLVFMTMMFVGRMLTSLLYRVCEKNTVLQLAGVLIFIGFLTSSLLIKIVDGVSLKVVVNSIGFMLIGLGISCVVPTLYSIVAEKSKTPAGLALTIMSTISFAGPLVAPLMVGAISEKLGLEWAYFAIALVGLGIVAVARFGKGLK